MPKAKNLDNERQAPTPKPTGRSKKTTGAARARRVGVARATPASVDDSDAAAVAAPPVAGSRRKRASAKGVRQRTSADGAADPLAATLDWFAAREWTVFPFQREAWQAWHDGASGLIHSPTGSGKTLAAWLGPLQGALNEPTLPVGLRVLWITPLRALANDTRANLQAAATALGAELEVELRTGDTSSARRTRQTARPPFALVTTPESLSIMLASAEYAPVLAGVTTVVVDEWHELMGTKRGVQLELCLERVRSLAPTLRVWGLSATLDNLEEARSALLGPDRPGTLIRGSGPRTIEIVPVLPPPVPRFPWSGHMGLTLVEPVAEHVERAATTLVFTNTRAQAEYWFRALLEARPDWIETLALHHGSIDRALRESIEERLRTGALRCVVCTSSLDLGVDFHPVDQVMQIGSPKAVARLMQRAGRSGHRPGVASRIVCVPTNGFELVEIAAVRRAIAAGRIEGRRPITRALDVLAQHLVTVALGAGFVAEEMRAEVRRTHAFAELSDLEWNWTLDFVTRGGQALQGYPQYRKVVEVAGVHRVMNREVGIRHRQGIGTIASDTTMNVAFLGGKRLGSIQEGFIARLRAGDVFQFAGRELELVMTKELTAYVRSATGKRKKSAVPSWQGTSLPISDALADTVLDTLQAWRQGTADEAELVAIDDLLSLQSRWSHLPGPGDFLVEMNVTGDGHSVFCYPFAGRLVHEGLAMLVAERLTAAIPSTWTLTVNDYGFELQNPNAIELDEATLRAAFVLDDLLEDVLRSVNSSEIAKRRFRDIARIAGLVFDGPANRRRTARQTQASSGLIFDVLTQHDRENLLLEQARREVLEAQLEYRRLEGALAAIADARWVITRPTRLSPLGFPLWAESLQSQMQTVSSESWKARIERMAASLEAAADEDLAPARRRSSRSPGREVTRG